MLFAVSLSSPSSPLSHLLFLELLNNTIVHARERGAANYNGNAAMAIRVFETSIDFVDKPANKNAALLAFTIIAMMVVAYVDTIDVFRRLARFAHARVLECSIKVV